MRSRSPFEHDPHRQGQIRRGGLQRLLHREPDQADPDRGAATGELDRGIDLGEVAFVWL